MKKNTLRVLSVAAMAALFLAACGQTNKPGSSVNENPESSVADVTTSEVVSTSEDVSSSETLPENYCKTIAEAIAIANEAGETGTTIEYRVSGTVKTVKNATYGEMTISDSTGELYIYGINNYSTMDPKPVAGDTVVLEGKLQVYKSTPEMGKANLISFEHKDSGGSSDVEIPADGVITTIAQAIEIAKSFGETYSTQKFTVTGVIDSIQSMTYGQVTIKDSTGSLSIYGIYGPNGEYFNTLETIPAVGDTITVEGSLHFFKEAAEMGKATLKNHVPSGNTFDESAYSVSTVKAAREAADGSKVKLTGVVAQYNVNSSKAKTGFWIVDGTESIYVYGENTAALVNIGNTVTVCGEKVHFVAEKEQNAAATWGYKGAVQISNAHLISNDKKESDWDKSWVKETTMKTVIDTPVTEDITGSICKLNALITKKEGIGFVNYYIDDIDGRTGTYAYTMANGADLAWLDEFDGKICTVYLSVLNAKSTATGCNWRVFPIKVSYDNYAFPKTSAPQYVLDYEVDEQFESTYAADPEIEMITSVSSTLLGFENVKVTYESSNTDVIYFETKDDKTVMHTKDDGKATVTIKAELDGVSASKTIEIEVKSPDAFDALNVGQAIAAATDTEVTVKGVVVGSYANKHGFFINDSTGTIAVLPTDGDTTCATVAIGDEVVVKGTRETYTTRTDGTIGQVQINKAEVVANLYGGKAMDKTTFITDKTIADVVNIADDATVSQEKVYACEGYLSAYDRSFGIFAEAGGDVKIGCYCSGAGQFSSLTSVFSATTKVTVYFMLVNPNNKTYWKAMPLAATDGTTTAYNTLYVGAPR